MSISATLIPRPLVLVETSEGAALVSIVMSMNTTLIPQTLELVGTLLTNLQKLAADASVFGTY